MACSVEIGTHYACKQEINFYESIDTHNVKHLGVLTRGEIIEIMAIHPATEHSLMKLEVRFELKKPPLKVNSGWIPLENEKKDTYFQKVTVNKREQCHNSAVVQDVTRSNAVSETRSPTTPEEADYGGNSPEASPSQTKKKATQKSPT